MKRVSGKTLKDFAAENLFQPLGMEHSQFRNDHTALIPNRALAYEPRKNGGYKLSVSYGEENGDGMVNTTVPDLQKWDENFYSGRVGGKDLLADMEKQGKLSDGSIVESAKGLWIRNYRGFRTVSYSGGSGGYHAFLLRFPERHFSVACLCNMGARTAKRTHRVAHLYLAAVMSPKEAVPAATLRPEELQVWAGVYRDLKKGEVWRVSSESIATPIVRSLRRSAQRLEPSTPVSLAAACSSASPASGSTRTWRPALTATSQGGAGLRATRESPRGSCSGTARRRIGFP